MPNQLLPITFSGRLMPSILLLLVSLFLLGCSQPNHQPVEIVFAFGPDDLSGSLQPLIDQFNNEHEGQIKVTWNKGSRFSDAFYHELKAEFESGEPQFDLIGSDVIWTPAFASNGWVEDLSQKFFASHNPAQYLNVAMESVSYQYKVWGLPWYTDAGMLYYRKDLLKQAGIEYPPATWQEVIDMSKQILKDSEVKTGYVFQGADYEGGVTNACEFIWNAEGDVLIGDLYVSESFDQDLIDPDIITINSDASRAGLTDLISLIESGIVPDNISEFREQEAAQHFTEGNALFMRSWASSYGAITSKGSTLQPKQVGLTALPTTGRTMTPYSCLGGWNLMISAFSNPEKQEAAWQFIEFLASIESQRTRALAGGYLPTLRSLYEDEKFLKKSPVADFARQVIPVCKERPRSPFYMEMSPEISNVFTRLVKGEIESNAAVKMLDVRLTEILKKHQPALARR